ncbi:hypothetical protein [Streptomyces sp. NPDC053048]|uniref:hypothetical protein n=1 Tax=Streptomyces sp. NPDC053048 TaxID=3365694 RepID=UPI0037D44F72
MKAIRKCVLAAVGATLVLGLTGCSSADEEGTHTPRAALKAAALKTTQQNSYRTGQTVDGTRTELAFQRKPKLVEKKVWHKAGSGRTGLYAHTVGDANAEYLKKAGDSTWLKSGNLPGVARPPADPEVEKRSEGYLPNMIGSLATAKDLEKVGEETVNGRATTHYRGTVVPLEMEDYKGDVMNDAVRDHFASARKRAHHVKAEVDLWIGEDDLVVKAQEVATTSNGESRTVEEYSGYGADPGITIPRGEDVVAPDRSPQDEAGRDEQPSR